MKRISTIMILAAGLAAVSASCQKETSDMASQEMTTISFVSERPQFEADTRTAWDGKRIVWSSGDAIRMAYTVDGVWQDANGDVAEGAKAKFYASNSATFPYEGDASTATFTISDSFSGSETGAHKFYALYPGKSFAVSGTDFTAPDVTVSIPVEQSLNADTFDPAADLMHGVSAGTYESRPDYVNLEWKRLVAHAHITLKALKDFSEEETLQNVILTFTTIESENGVAGKYALDLTAGELKPSDISNEIALKNGNVVLDADGNATFWAAMFPSTVTSLKVVAETDLATYTREISNLSLEFKRNMRNTLSIRMDSAERVAKETESELYYVKVTSEPATWEGKYLIVCEEASVAVTGSETDATAIKSPTDVVIADGKIMATSAMNAISVSIEYEAEGQPGLLKTASGYYIYHTNSTSESHFKATDRAATAGNYQLTVSLNGENAVVLSGAGYLRYNSSNKIFNFYPSADSQKAIQLYRLQDTNQ